MMHFRFIFGILILLASGQIQAFSQQACLSYEPAVVKLQGTIISRTYPGPPEYQSIRNGDEPETYWLLALNPPVCVAKQNKEPYGYPAQENVRRIQLVFKDVGAYKTYRKLLGRRVTAAGTLYGATTAHHKTPVLLTVSSLKPAKSVVWHLNFSDSRLRSPLTPRQFSNIHTEGAENARKAAAYIAEHGPTNHATAYIITNGEEPTRAQVRRLGDVDFVQRVGNVFLLEPGPAPHRHPSLNK